MWCGIICWIVASFMFLGGYVVGRSFKAHDNQWTSQDRDELVFMLGFYRAYNVPIEIKQPEQAYQTSDSYLNTNC